MGRGPDSINRLRRMQGPRRKFQRTIEREPLAERQQKRRTILRGGHR